MRSRCRALRNRRPSPKVSTCHPLWRLTEVDIAPAGAEPALKVTLEEPDP